jgi:hypothetical protein
LEAEIVTSIPQIKESGMTTFGWTSLTFLRVGDISARA